MPPIELGFPTARHPARGRRAGRNASVRSCAVGVVVIVASLLGAWSRPASALPAFARAHALSCGVCHSALPRLNAYGRAFRERGYVLPGTAPSKPLPITTDPARAVADGLSFWVRGPGFVRDDFRRGHDRTAVDVPSRIGAYLASPLPAHMHVLLEGEATLRDVESRPGGRFTRTTELALERGFVTIDAGALAGEASMGAPGDGGAIVQLGRFDPSGMFPYPTRRDLFHTVPGDTERSETGSDIQRFPLTPYAFGARFFGLFDRSGHVLLPTTASLFNTAGNLGAEMHGRLPRLPLSWSIGVLNGAAPRFPDTGDTVDPYALLRYDVVRGETAGSLAVLVDYGPGTTEVRFTAAEAADGRAGRRTLDWLRTGVAASVAHRGLELRGAFLHDELFRVPGTLDAAFDATSSGLSIEASYRPAADWLTALRYDWMDPGGFASTIAGLDGPRSGQALHVELRWYVMQGRTRPRSAPVLVALSLRDSVNLTPGGGSNPLRTWQNTALIGIDVAH